ncbi:flagellar basal body rod protein FlgB [Halobacillus sp. A1]|uniref:flagellar basal body rod protein FlgB n=1 Tax=Halobacillus sp. A1 TaxID=2880262 RepID=UPI0020A6D37F|nr:flagellar basal body rod protein FlgB [Halobacillus sp. A1]MCP3031188.1 flagellar basal body rod protein FlgB [Halobacillus sp. A1]
MKLFNDTFTTLESSLNHSSKKNRAISENIANVDTPGYKAKDVVFKNVLSEEMGVSAKRTNERHLNFGNGQPTAHHTVRKEGTTYNHNGNNVDIDKEMNDLAKNQIQYQALVDRLSGKFNSLKSVIRGGN